MAEVIKRPPGGKILVLGGNSFHDQATVHAALDRLHKRAEIWLMIFHDPSQGAQLLALEWCKARGVVYTSAQPGEAWGLFAPDGAVAFPDTELDREALEAQAGQAKVWHPTDPTKKKVAA
jgi:hypothetical protein